MTDREKIDLATDYLYRHRDIMNMSEVADRIAFHKGNLHRALHRYKYTGKPVRIPARCLPGLRLLFSELKQAPKL